MAKSSTTFKKGHTTSQATRDKIRMTLLGRKLTDEHKENIRKANDGKCYTVMTDAIREKISKTLTGVPIGSRYIRTDAIKKKMSISKLGKNIGEKHFKWIKDRSTLKIAYQSEERRSSRYHDWRKNVCNRDNWKCKISNGDCSGRIEVHHILGFTEHPELKYDINNGITLCHFHHPRKRSEEANLSPYFKSLVMNVK